MRPSYFAVLLVLLTPLFISIDSFHSFDTNSNSIASSAINPIATLQEAKSYLDDLEAYMAKKPA